MKNSNVQNQLKHHNDDKDHIPVIKRFMLLTFWSNKHFNNRPLLVLLLGFLQVDTTLSFSKLLAEIQKCGNRVYKKKHNLVTAQIALSALLSPLEPDAPGNVSSQDEDK